MDRIKEHAGIPWKTETVDRFVAGDGNVRVAGIATTMMATLEVLQHAAAQGNNFVITHEPTFYLHQDTTEDLANDPVYQFKARFIREHDMAVFRFHDHWHAMKPDGIAFGMMRDLGWEKNADPNDQHHFSFPGPSLADFAGGIAARLKIRTMRVVGDPALPVRSLRASWGAAGRDSNIRQFSQPDTDVLIVGEAREWETVEYAQDAIAAGQKKALIVMGHVVSEQAGMKYCAEWLRQFVPEAPVEFVPAPEPFWTPGSHRG